MTSEDRSTKITTVYEIVAIVASILLAFAIDAWWDEWREGREAREILVDLREELGALDAGMAAREDGWAAARADMDRLLGAIRAEEVPAVPVMDTLLHQVTWSPTFDPGTGALDALLSSGRLEWIDDLALRTRIAGLPGVIQELRDNEEVGREFVTLVLQPYLAEAGVPVARSLRLGRDWTFPQGSETEADAAYRRILADPAFESHVAFRYSWVNEGEYRAAREHLRGLLERLEAELSR